MFSGFSTFQICVAQHLGSFLLCGCISTSSGTDRMLFCMHLSSTLYSLVRLQSNDALLSSLNSHMWITKTGQVCLVDRQCTDWGGKHWICVVLMFNDILIKNWHKDHSNKGLLSPVHRHQFTFECTLEACGHWRTGISDGARGVWALAWESTHLLPVSQHVLHLQVITGAA